MQRSTPKHQRQLWQLAQPIAENQAYHLPLHRVTPDSYDMPESEAEANPSIWVLAQKCEQTESDDTVSVKQSWGVYSVAADGMQQSGLQALHQDFPRGNSIEIDGYTISDYQNWGNNLGLETNQLGSFTRWLREIVQLNESQIEIIRKAYAQSVGGPFLAQLRNLASDHQIWDTIFFPDENIRYTKIKFHNGLLKFQSFCHGFKIKNINTSEVIDLNQSIEWSGTFTPEGSILTYFTFSSNAIKNCVSGYHDKAVSSYADAIENAQALSETHNENMAFVRRLHQIFQPIYQHLLAAVPEAELAQNNSDYTKENWVFSLDTLFDVVNANINLLNPHQLKQILAGDELKTLLSDLPEALKTIFQQKFEALEEKIFLSSLKINKDKYFEKLINHKLSQEVISTLQTTDNWLSQTTWGQKISAMPLLEVERTFAQNKTFKKLITLAPFTLAKANPNIAAFILDNKELTAQQLLSAVEISSLLKHSCQDNLRFMAALSEDTRLFQAVKAVTPVGDSALTDMEGLLRKTTFRRKPKLDFKRISQTLRDNTTDNQAFLLSHGQDFAVDNLGDVLQNFKAQELENFFKTTLFNPHAKNHSALETLLYQSLQLFVDGTNHEASVESAGILATQMQNHKSLRKLIYQHLKQNLNKNPEDTKSLQALVHLAAMDVDIAKNLLKTRPWGRFSKLRAILDSLSDAQIIRIIEAHGMDKAFVAFLQPTGWGRDYISRLNLADLPLSIQHHYQATISLPTMPTNSANMPNWLQRFTKYEELRLKGSEGATRHAQMLKENFPELTLEAMQALLKHTSAFNFVKTHQLIPLTAIAEIMNAPDNKALATLLQLHYPIAQEKKSELMEKLIEKLIEQANLANTPIISGTSLGECIATAQAELNILNTSLTPSVSDPEVINAQWLKHPDRNVSEILDEIIVNPALGHDFFKDPEVAEAIITNVNEKFKKCFTDLPSSKKESFMFQHPYLLRLVDDTTLVHFIQRPFIASEHKARLANQVRTSQLTLIPTEYVRQAQKTSDPNDLVELFIRFADRPTVVFTDDMIVKILEAHNAKGFDKLFDLEIFKSRCAASETVKEKLASNAYIDSLSDQMRAIVENFQASLSAATPISTDFTVPAIT